MDEIIQKPLMYFAAGEDGNIDFPDGLIGRFYSFALAPQAGIRTERFSLSEGTLPVGLTLGEDTGLIQGTPTEGGAAQFTIAATNSEGQVNRIKGLIRVWRILTFGEHGTFKGCNGLQMAFNMAQDVDEIRVEQGTYQCDAIEIKGKNWQHGIRVSGGWNSTFENQNLDPVLTVLDGGEKRIVNIENSIECEQAGGYWESLSFSCFKKQPSEKPILTISAGPVVIEGLSFQNGHSISGGAILSHTNGDLSITNSIFTNNSASGFGGAISGSSNIINSVFNNNSADLGSGAVSGSNNIINSIFINNSAIECGAVSSVSNIINSIFIKNNASKGGAICGSRLIINSTFVNNNASDEGGALEAFYGSGTILNSIFSQNHAAEEANDISPYGELHVDYTLANYISGAVDLGTHFIMGDPRFVDPDNGNFHLLPDSPAINVGDPNVIEDYDFPTNEQGQVIDLEGKLRIIGEGIDLGAYEFQ